MSNTTPNFYATPLDVQRLDQCWFYHTIELPGFGEVKGDWDLRAGIDDYLGREPLAGKRVLDMGAASGFLTFHAERAGAREVVAYDLAPHMEWDSVPFGGAVAATDAEERFHSIRNINNSFWLSHRAVQSRARMVHGSIYAVPEAIGPVDVCLFGSILLHLRDPFLALQNGCKLARETVIVTDCYRPGLAIRALDKLGLASHAMKIAGPPRANFLPNYRTQSPRDTWWDLSPALVVEMLGVLGFPKTTITFHAQPHRGTPSRLFTVIGRR